MLFRSAADVEWPDGLITGVNAAKTRAGRHKTSLPGECFRRAGWAEFAHPSNGGGRAGLWLRCMEVPSVGVKPPYIGRGQESLALEAA